MWSLLGGKMSKGSKRRPQFVDEATIQANWNRIFNRKCPEDMWEHVCEFNGAFYVEKGAECDWCGKTEPDVYNDRNI